MAEPNFKPRTLFQGDNLKLLRALNSKCVDLVAFDPPFKKGHDFKARPGTLAEGASFEDIWRWDEVVHPAWIRELQEFDRERVRSAHDEGGLWTVVEAANTAWGTSMGAYLVWMAVRLLECHRVLKPTGSIYLHCDPDAAHYLKLLLDVIFGKANFRNELIWCYTGPGHVERWFKRKHDDIFFYAKTAAAVFNADAVRVPYKGKAMGSDRSMVTGARTTEELMTEEEKAQRRGKVIEDWWYFGAGSHMPLSDQTGYPTGKPVNLYRRMILASTNPGDLVLDICAGSGTTLIAAEHLNRGWIGVDYWEGAQKWVVEHMLSVGMLMPSRVPEHLLVNFVPASDGQGWLGFNDLTFTDDLPERTDTGEVAAPILNLKKQLVMPKWARLSRDAIFERLVKAQTRTGKVICAGCGDGFRARHMQVDHVSPRKDGGKLRISNAVLLCGPCNRDKGSKLTLDGLRDELGEDMVDKDAAKWAFDQAQEAADEAQIELGNGA